MIASPIILPLAIKYANKIGRIHLSAKLSELMPQFEEQVSRTEYVLRDVRISGANKSNSLNLGKTKRETFQRYRNGSS